ncbi:MAG: hypothetical protein KJO91_06620 [Gammaproteobacteria bacterium]|nr:hypothetical protein [Gammaproteobacteria bacterium]
MVVKKPAGYAEEDVVIRRRGVFATSPEGQTVGMRLDTFIEILTGTNSRFNNSLILPDGIKLTASRGSFTIWVYERAPQVYSLKWIAAQSPKPYGRGTMYRTIRIALPYLIVLAVFEPERRYGLQLSHRNECFFLPHPLKSTEDELFYPALLNCSKFDPPEGRPLSWICTTKLNYKRKKKDGDENSYMKGALKALLHTLLETGYNHSSDHHEASSWFTESIGIDPRISTVENWEKATANDPLFVLDVPWLRTGRSLGQIIERIFGNLGAKRPKLSSATDIKRILFNYGKYEIHGIPF